MRQADAAAAPPITSPLVAWSGEQIEDAGRTTILNWPHVLAHRLRIQETGLSLDKQNEREDAA